MRLLEGQCAWSYNLIPAVLPLEFRHMRNVEHFQILPFNTGPSSYRFFNCPLQSNVAGSARLRVQVFLLQTDNDLKA